MHHLRRRDGGLVERVNEAVVVFCDGAILVDVACEPAGFLTHEIED